MLSPDQLQVLYTSWKLSSFVVPSKLTKGTSLFVPDVALLARDGYLDKALNKYLISKSGIEQLRLADFDLSDPQKEDGPTNVKQTLSEKLEQVGGRTEVLKSHESRKQILFEIARRKLIAGDPFPMIRLQWPELIIADPLDLKYFKANCTRTDNLDLRLDDRQCDLIKHTFDQSIRQIAIKGSTSPGKGFATALAINLWYTAFQDARIVLLGPSVSHAKEIMFAEVSAWRKKMRMPGPGDMLSVAIKDPENPQHALFIANPETGEGLSGRHGAHTLFAIDESSSVLEDLFVNAQKQAKQIICISNPRVLSGWFYDLFPRVDPNANQTIVDRGVRRRLITFGGKDCINVRAKRLHVPVVPPGGLEVETIDGEKYTLQEFTEVPPDVWPHVKALIPGQMDYLKYSEIMAKPNEIERAWSGEGHFPPEDLEFQILPPSWIKPCCEKWVGHSHEIKVTAFGLDLAASEDKDETVLAVGGPKGIKKLYKTRKSNSVETMTWLRNIFSTLGIDPLQDYYPIGIDCVGAGGNVMADMLEANGAVVIRHKGNSSAENKHLYMNSRAELYGQLSERLNPESEHLDTFMLPDDHELREELAAHEKIYATDMIRFQLTPKRKVLTGPNARIQSIKEKLGRSPDSADAVVLCYDAIMQTEIDENVTEQFNPSELIVSHQRVVGRNGEQYEVEYADGSRVIRDNAPEDYISVSEVARQFESFLRKVTPGNMFD